MPILFNLVILLLELFHKEGTSQSGRKKPKLNSFVTCKKKKKKKPLKCCWKTQLFCWWTLRLSNLAKYGTSTWWKLYRHQIIENENMWQCGKILIGKCEKKHRILKFQIQYMYVKIYIWIRSRRKGNHHYGDINYEWFSLLFSKFLQLSIFCLVFKKLKSLRISINLLAMIILRNKIMVNFCFKAFLFAMFESFPVEISK